MESLARKYGGTDPLAIARKALSAGKTGEAIFALETAADRPADAKIKNLLLLEAYLEAGRTKDALFIATSQAIDDAHFDNLCGRLYQKLGKSQTALECFENALNKPSIMRSHTEIRNDALFYTALVRGTFTKRSVRRQPRPAGEQLNLVKKMYGRQFQQPAVQTGGSGTGADQVSMETIQLSLPFSFLPPSANC